MEELSNKTGGAVSKQTISKYESGKAMAGSDILEKLANALKVPMDYFFRPFYFDISKINISFRKKSSIKAKDESSLVSKIQRKHLYPGYVLLEQPVYAVSDHYRCRRGYPTKCSWAVH